MNHGELKYRFTRSNVLRMETDGVLRRWAEAQNVDADERGLLFLSSPFSTEAVELLERVGVAAWKIASGEVGNNAMIDRLLASSRPIWLSTGMSSLAEIDRSVTYIGQHTTQLTVLQCTSMYPTPPERVGLNMLDVYQSGMGVMLACQIILAPSSQVLQQRLSVPALSRCT